MIIALFSYREQLPKHVVCSICESKMALTEATICFFVANHPAFACASHLNKSQERARFRAWLNFMVHLQLAAAFAFVVRKLVVIG